MGWASQAAVGWLAPPHTLPHGTYPAVFPVVQLFLFLLAVFPFWEHWMRRTGLSCTSTAQAIARATNCIRALPLVNNV